MIPVSPGTVVAVKEWWGEHWGIAGVDQYGQLTIISNRGLRGGVTEERWQDVVGNAEWRIVDLSGQLPAYFVLERARSRIGSRYDFWTSNCQDLVYWALGLTPQSPQRDGVAALLSLAGLVFLLGMVSKRA